MTSVRDVRIKIKAMLNYIIFLLLSTHIFAKRFYICLLAISLLAFYFILTPILQYYWFIIDFPNQTDQGQGH